jgi:predicted NAD-dependent protein-ADP-ribosyltransferase YbiA (DUF1768 family)
MDSNSRFRFFWGHTAKPGQLTDAVFSQFWPCEFTVDGVRYRWAEQWMMAGKARLFGDHGALELVVQGNLHKFGQDAALKAHLLSTGDDVLVEASPTDRIWGIGMAASNPDAKNPSKWRGQNLLGKALMEVRARLRYGAAHE